MKATYNISEYEYLNLCKDILEFGIEKNDRTGVGTRSLFGRQLQFDLGRGFPLLTTKKVHFKSVAHELLWFLSGSTNIQYLKDNNVSIWDEWADQNGDLGPVYGKQWRNWSGQDQIATLIDQLRTNPDSRRHIVSAWNVAELDQMALPPCHCFFQFYVRGEYLDCQLYQRSADVFLGVPFNIASYALLMQMVAQQVEKKAGKLTITFGDVHLYNNHVNQLWTQLTRPAYDFPDILINKARDIFSYTIDDITLLNYKYHPAIKAPVAV